MDLLDTNKVQISMKSSNTVLIFTFERGFEDEIEQKPVPPKDPPIIQEPPSIIEKDRGSNIYKKVKYVNFSLRFYVCRKLLIAWIKSDKRRLL